MRARLRIGFGGPILPTQGLKFSVETGGGNLSFLATMTDLAATGALDPSKVTLLEFETSPGAWTPVYPYALRPPFHRSKVGNIGMVQMNGASIPQVWGKETVIFPEYVTTEMPQGAGTERGLGWMNTAYNPVTDPRITWRSAYEDTRVFPSDPPWPSGTGAKWINASGTGNRKIFRKNVTINGSGPQTLRLYASSDENLNVWFAAEQILSYSITEWGRKNTYTADLVVFPGTYALCLDTVVHVTKGGDARDMVLAALAYLDNDGDPTSWATKTNDSWLCCRFPSTAIPPGPTPGAIIQDLIGEAVTRGTCSWDQVTFGFSGTHDSYGHPWTVATERLVRYGADDYEQIFNGLGETEADIWMDSNLTLYAAPKQGVVRSYVWNETQIPSMSDSLNDHATAVMGLTHDGWVWGSIGGWRRESYLEVGQALSLSLGQAVAAAALGEANRWDASFDYKPGQYPLLDFGIGDWVTIDYQDIYRQVRILSIAGRAGEGGLLWAIEVTNEPP